MTETMRPMSTTPVQEGSANLFTLGPNTGKDNKLHGEGLPKSPFTLGGTKDDWGQQNLNGGVEISVGDAEPVGTQEGDDVEIIMGNAEPVSTRLGDRVGDRINQASDKTREIIGNTKSRVRTIGRTAISPLIAVGNKANEVADKLNDIVIERDHAAVDTAILRQEKRDNRVSPKQWVSGIREIRTATKGMRGSEKAKFGEELTILERASKLDAIEQSATSAMSRADERKVERNSRKGDSYAETGKEIDSENIEARYIAESKRADTSADGKFNRQLNRLNRAQRRETAIDNVRSNVQNLIERSNDQVGTVMSSASAKKDVVKSRLKQNKVATAEGISRAKTSARTKVAENVSLARDVAADALQNRAETQFARAVSSEQRGFTKLAERKLARSGRTFARAERIAHK
ncbi:hypothetical protein KA068_01370 [Candidatus Saccharibacteria bacterium]|jgi:hypothetical protein|nr:hypothetical protein [Candidatus Saccharibacteria bacterium]